MVGFIRRREVLRHSVLVIRLYGWRAWGRALTARRGATFLAIVFRRETP